MSPTKALLAATVFGASMVCSVAPAARADTLTFWTLNFNTVELSAIKSIISSYEQANPGTTIQLESRGTDAQKEALRVAADSSLAPDIYFMWAGPGLGGEFIKSGLAAPMGKYYKQYGWDNRFYPEVLEFSKKYPGGQYGVPFDFHAEGIYYNKALFKQAGITKTPQTYQELLADAAKLEKAGIPAFTFGGTVNWHLMRLMDVLLETECGAATHDALTNLKADWSTQACATNAFEQLHLWTSKYTLTPFMGISDEQSFNLFLAGRAAMMIEGDWLVDRLTQDGANMSDYGVFPFPTGTNRLYGFTSFNYVSSKSKNPDLGAQFLNYMTSTPVQQKYLGAFGAFSVNKDVKYNYSSPLFQSWLKILNSSQGLYINGDQAFPLVITEDYWRVINGVATDEIAPDKAAADLQNFINTHKK